MNATPKTRPQAFSLIEVVLAIAIVSFALLTTLGLFGGIMKASSDNSQRREMVEAVDSLRSFLNSTNFATAYDWVKADKQLVYVTYKSATNGNPSASSESVMAKWIDPDAESTASYEAARSGKWLRARLSVSPSNPGGTNLTAVANYKKASIFVCADIDVIAAPGQTITNSSRLQSTMAVLR